MQVQLGTSGGVVATGYSGSSSNLSSAVTSASYTTGFGIKGYDAIAYVMSGIFHIANVSSNTWVASGTLGNPTSVVLTSVTGGSVALGGTLDRVRITTVNGTDTFDSGSINLLYE
jgi:hypothetical protein